MNALGKEEPKLKPKKNKEQTSETTRPWCGTAVLSGTGRPCHIAAPPWLGSSYLARLGCFDGELFARPFGLI